MSIYIKGMEMPKDGERALWLVIHSDGTVEYDDNKGFGWQTATAIPVPEHRRLIDADEFFKALTMDDRVSILEAMYVQSILSDAPTIIPADKETYNDII